MAGVPDDILYNIMERLPLKSLVRSKFISNQWKNLITSPGFVENHRKNALENPDSNALLIFTSGSSLYIVDDLSTSSLRPTKLTLPPSFQDDKTIKLVGSCNGLLCIGCGLFLNSYFLFNPINSSAFKIVPFAHNTLSRDAKFAHIVRSIDPYTNLYDVHIASGFGYDVKTDDYKIVYIWCWSRRSYVDFLLDLIKPPNHDEYLDHVEGMIYSLKSGSWKPLKPPNIGTQWTYCGALNNHLHFVPKYDEVDVILSFDLHDEEWSEVCFPATEYFYTVKDVFFFEECLSVLMVPDDYEYQELWVMKEYGVQESWTRLYTLPFEKSCRIIYYSSRLRKFLLLVSVDQNCGLVWYNDQDKTKEMVVIQGNNVKISDVEVIIGSLYLIGE